MSIADLKNLNFFIAGAGQSGLAIAKLLKKNNLSVFLTENKAIVDQIKLELVNLDIPFEEMEHNFNHLLLKCDALIISPGIPLNSQLILTCKKNSIPVISEIEASSWFYNTEKIVLGITGTNGKSTTTNYLAQLLNKKYKAKACGNIGVPLSSIVLNAPEISAYVIEFSSYQLETTYSVRPYCSIFLNIQNDHLQRYENLSEYLKAKWRLISLTLDNGLIIIEKNVLKLALHFGLSLPRAKLILIDIKNFPTEKSISSKITNFLSRFDYSKTLPISLYKELKDLDINSLLLPSQYESVYAKFLENGSISVSYNSSKYNINWKIPIPCLPGQHNMFNICAASICALHLGISEHDILAQWNETSSEYIHLPHRLEKISPKYSYFKDDLGQNKQLVIINDSKATNVESTLVALESFKQPIRLLLGGEPKGDSYLPISKYFGKNVIKVYPFGQASSVITEELKDFHRYFATSSKNLISAATQALNDAQDNEIILLSPACSSFDEFNNFEHRGDIFRSWALSHIKG